MELSLGECNKRVHGVPIADNEASQAGIPAGVVNIVPGYGAVAGAALVAHHMVAKVMFTGSTVTGKRIAAEAANTLKPIGLELGGKSAVIVYEDAPIDQAAQIATTAIFSNQGQICTAGSRLLLHAEIHDKVLEKVVENAKRVKIGDQMDPSTTMGPLISVRQKERVRGYIESGKRDAKLAYSGEVPKGLERGFFVGPTIFDGVQSSMTPYGGYKQSGYGREMGFSVMRELTQEKSVWVNVR